MRPDALPVLSLAISFLAFLISGIALGWNIYRDGLDRGRLKLELMIARWVEGIGDAQGRFIESGIYADSVATGRLRDNGGTDQLVLTITNVGRRPIVATKWVGIAPNFGPRKQFIVVGRDLPKTLQPGEFTIEWNANPRMLLEPDVEAILVVDSTGKEWRLPKNKLRRAKASAARLTRHGGNR